MLQHLREQVLEANLELVRRGLVLYTFGNASGISREEGLVVIKPSGVPYEEMKTGASGGHRSARRSRGRQFKAIL
jgi:L-ribulose-5-phosphate 4-epimerase